MNFIRKSLGSIFLSLVLVLFASAAYAGPKITIAEMNWASAEFMANVDKIIFEKGFGFEVELVAGATMPTFTSMKEKGEPDVAPEQWMNSILVPLNEALAEGRVYIANEAPIEEVGEGWWITPATAKRHPELKTVLDILEHPELFPYSEDKSKGAFVGCPAGWGCQLNNANLYRAFKMKEKGWVLVDPGSGAGMDGSIAKAAERDENWFGYYWAPTAMVGKYNLVKIPFGVPYAGKDNWDNCIAKPQQDCADPKPSAWTKSGVNTVVSANFKKTGGPEAMTYLSKRIYPLNVMNSMLVYMSNNQADGADAAIEFFQKYENIWTQWVSSKVAAKVKAGIK
jgi:glycine betaine/proline transport system substrate-binding protein